MKKTSRAEYFRRRRETKGQFMVMVDKEILARFDAALAKKALSRAAWLRQKIAEDLQDGEEEE